jgi:hypothetical protein
MNLSKAVKYVNISGEVQRIRGAAHGFIFYPKFASPVGEAYKEMDTFLEK